MEELLSGKTALVTGASRGIGKACAILLAENGAKVYANVRNEAKAAELEKETSGRGLDIRPLIFDVTDVAQIKEAMMTIRKESGALQVLVNNAGIMKDALVGMINERLCDELFKVNVYGVINMIQYAAKIMDKSGGSIINMASIAGQQGAKGGLVYSAAKGAVIALTKSAAKDLAPRNIRVNAVAPGLIDTDLLASMPEEKKNERIAHISLNRLGRPSEVANAVLFLASSMSEYITGEVVSVNGGATI